MVYELPALQILKDVAGQLESGYRNGNPERVNFIKLAKSVSQQDFSNMPEDEAVKILMGMYCFELEAIENSYRVLSQSRSQMYDLIQRKLNLNGKSLSHEKKLVYINAFYQYIDKTAPDNIAEQTSWVSKTSVKKAIVEVEKDLLAKQSPQVECVLSSLPAPGVLFDKLSNIKDKYESASKSQTRWFSSGMAHSQQASFLDLINEYCDRFLPAIDPKSLDRSLLSQDAYMLRVGAAVYVMKSIEDTYTCRSGTSSTLHNICSKSIKEAGNFDTRAINLDDRITWLALLSVHVKNMQENHKEFLQEMEAKGYKNIMADLKKIEGNIWRNLGAYATERDAPSRIHSNMAFATSGVAQAGISAVIKNVAGDVIPSPAGMFIDSAAGVTGFAVLGPGGAVLGSTLSRMVRTHLVPLAVAGVFAGALDKVGSTIGSTVTGIVILPFSLTASGLQALVSLCNGPQFDKSALLKDEEYLKTLQSLPDDVFSSENKTVVANTFGIR